MAGRGAGRRRFDEVRALLHSHNVPFESVVTEGPGHATVLAKEAAAAGTPVVAACGGDGTISQVANGLVGSESALAVVPLGTGNDLARHLSIAKLETAVRTLAEGVATAVDLIGWKGHEAAGYLINVAGCGFDAVVAERVNRGFRGVSGTAAYVAGVVATLATFRSASLSLEIDGKNVQCRGMLCAVANASSYGGGMRIAPEARIDDGLLEVVVIQEVGRLEFLRTFPRVFKGTHVTHHAVSVFRGKQVRVGSDPPWPVLCDGEICGTTPVTFEIKEKALRVLVPASRSLGR